ncbi:MAG: sensor histidine kinase [Acidimicrobiales bacterium]
MTEPTPPVTPPSQPGSGHTKAEPSPSLLVTGQHDVATVARPKASFRRRVVGSVRFRLTATVVVVVGVALLCGGILLVRWVEATLTNDLRDRNERVLTAMVSALRQNQVPAELFSSPSEIQGQLEDQMSSALVDSGSNVDQVVSTTYFYIDGPGLAAMVFAKNPEGRIVLFNRQGPALPPPSESLEVSKDLSGEGATLTLHAVSPLSEITRSVGALSAALWLGLPLLVFAAGVMTWVNIGRALAPVGAMTRRVRELSATSADAGVPVPPTNDEISQLATTMNEMLARLHEQQLKQRQFISDASHELRSPVASIRAQLETALRYPDDVDWPAIAGIVLAEDDRLDHLVGNLLAMARLEEGRFGPRTELELEDLVLAQTPRLTGVKLDVSGVSAGRVWGNSDELTSVIRNLLDNAARHAETTVAVTVREAGPWVVLSVGDDGEGVPVAERELVFERFRRLQESRERDSGGSGLGLALSRRIVDRHGGRIHVEDSSLGGASFVVSLPAAGWTGSAQDELDELGEMDEMDERDELDATDEAAATEPPVSDPAGSHATGGGRGV